MKTKAITFLAIAAIATLSFTAISVNNSRQVEEKKHTSGTTTKTSQEPAGGFLSEDKF